LQISKLISILVAYEDDWQLLKKHAFEVRFFIPFFHR